jgi:hypothetical protein
MKSRFLKVSGIVLLLFLVCAAEGIAGGLGVYGAYDFLVGSLGWYDNSSDFNRVKIAQAGILFDTCVAKDRLFNYRLQVGLDLSSASYWDADLAQTVAMNIWQISFINTFGFGLIREEALRFWFGPQLGFGVGFEPSFSDTAYYSVMSNFFELDMFAGVAMGLNIHLGNSVSLCADAGLRLHEDLMISPAAFYYGLLLKPFVEAGVIFRFGDVYEE